MNAIFGLKIERAAPIIPSEFHQDMLDQLKLINTSLSSPEELYQLSPAGVMFLVCSETSVDPYYIKLKGADDPKTRHARLKIIDMLSTLFDWKQEKIGQFINQKASYVFAAKQEIAALKSESAWPKND